MSKTQQGIRGQISPAILDKVNRLFRNDDAGVWIELLQNARVPARVSSLSRSLSRPNSVKSS